MPAAEAMAPLAQPAGERLQALGRHHPPDDLEAEGQSPDVTAQAGDCRRGSVVFDPERRTRGSPGCREKELWPLVPQELVRAEVLLLRYRQGV